jgi:hypothetical protein
VAWNPQGVRSGGRPRTKKRTGKAVENDELKEDGMKLKPWPRYRPVCETLSGGTRLILITLFHWGRVAWLTLRIRSLFCFYWLEE